jgi:hypothetical protein
MEADMSINCALDASLLNSASKVDRNGLRDIGLPLALGGVGRAGEGVAPGDVALLRNGLFEERFSVKPGDGRRAADKDGR